MSKLGLSASRPTTTHMDCNLKLTTKEYDDHVLDKTTVDDALLEDQGPYQKIIGNCYNNAYYAKVGGITTIKLNKMEMKFLASLDFRLYVSVESLDKYCL
ncbi:hypothetical protein FXO38_02128 [Capsicum annuum]|nr:hypothetical protein FXO38_02128 [Capsicum annuum]